MESQITVLPGIEELPLSDYQMLFFTQNKCLFQFDKESDYDEDNKNSSNNITSTPSDDHVYLVKGVWMKQEDDLLKMAIREFKNSSIDWNVVSANVPHRSAKQCKERWMYRLQPDVKKIPFEKWEDEVVVKERMRFGNHWTLIARKLPGRTAVAVKNRWYSVLRHRYNDFVSFD